MRLALLTAGSRGDVQPILALALGLTRAGHDVRVVSHANFASLAVEYGVDFHATHGDAQALVESEEGKAILRNRNPIRAWNAMMELARPFARDYAEVSLRACERVDAVGFSGLGMFFGLSASEKLELPVFGAVPVRVTPTREYPHPLLSSGPSWLPGFNRLSCALHRARTRRGSTTPGMGLMRTLLHSRGDRTRPPSGLERFEARFSRTSRRGR